MAMGYLRGCDAEGATEYGCVFGRCEVGEVASVVNDAGAKVCGEKARECVVRHVVDGKEACVRVTGMVLQCGGSTGEELDVCRRVGACAEGVLCGRIGLERR